MARVRLTYPPRLLPIPDAAAYLAVSETTLRGLPIPRKIHGGRKVYDILALDEYASSLPTEGDVDEVGQCDRVFRL